MSVWLKTQTHSKEVSSFCRQGSVETATPLRWDQVSNHSHKANYVYPTVKFCSMNHHITNCKAHYHSPDSEMIIYTVKRNGKINWSVCITL